VLRKLACFERIVPPGVVLRTESEGTKRKQSAKSSEASCELMRARPTGQSRRLEASGW